MFSQIPLYILLISFIITFFTGNKDQSETIIAITDILLKIVFISFCISCLVLILILVILNRDSKKALTYSIAGSILILAALYILFYYAAHIMFVAVPVVIVLYHAVLFTTYGRIYDNETKVI